MDRDIVRVYVGSLSQEYEALSVEASKHTTAKEIIHCIVQRLGFDNPDNYELAEVVGNSTGQECKERRIGPYESPVMLKLLWPKSLDLVTDQYRFCLRLVDPLWSKSLVMDPQIIRDYFYQLDEKEYPDLCQLTDLNELALSENLKLRFNAGHIYTYVGPILIAINPFRFHPIYNPKYVKLYQNRRREELPPHIFAIADSAYHTMLKEKKNQCIVISGESGSGKTESTNFLLHHLTALSREGGHESGVEQTILSAGPVLEAFGNAKTAHNNNSSRFGKFIQVGYRENGMVNGALVQKYLLEKSRICCQAKNERNYHVFYYLLAGANENERGILNLLPPHKYHYLNQSECYTLDGVDESYEFSRLKQSMEMVGFGPDTQRKLFCVLSAVLLIGNVEFTAKKSSYHHDESVAIQNPAVVRQISHLLRVTEDTLLAALTSKKARASGEMLVINYRMPEAIAARDAMAKCLYETLFDWIVLQVNHSLLSKKDSSADFIGNSIGVLDIFGFEDFGDCNSFEQFCINYANEHLQHYFNQHVFKYEQEEYKKEGIHWTNIDFMDNTPCLSFIEAKPNGLICILDDQCSFPGATNETLLQKFNSVHKDHDFYQIPQRREAAFIIRHYAGKVKYQIYEFREKNMDLMRHDIVSVLKNSSSAFVRELVGLDPVAVFRWAILRAFFRAYFSFYEAGYRHRKAKVRSSLSRAYSSPARRRSSNDHLINGIDTVDDNDGDVESETEDDELEDNGYDDDPGDSSTASTPIHLAFQCSNNSCPRSNGATNDSISSGLYFCYSCKKACSPAASSPLVEEYITDRNKTLRKNRSFRVQPMMSRGMKNLQSVKILASQTAVMGVSSKNVNPRKQPLSVSQQFQQSLHSLMITLNQANPFFIRCIKSNSDKTPSKFDDDIVQRQLRYTGMKETVRIRQAGYNVRLTFDEFIHLYRILLPKGLASDAHDVHKFLVSLNLNPMNYQLGSSKIFLREIEKIKLDYFLHQQIMASITRIQRWYRTVLDRRQFLRMHDAVIKIQSYMRMYLAQKFVANVRIRHLAATFIQKVWRGYSVRKWYEGFKSTCVQFQSRLRGTLVRRQYQKMLDEQRRLSKQKEKLQVALRVKTDGDTNSGQSDEAFLSKGSSQEELDENKLKNSLEFEDSEESSGVHEDSEPESAVLSLMQSLSNVNGPSTAASSSSTNTVGVGNLGGTRSLQHMPSLSESMPALTLALSASPFSLPLGETSSISQPLTRSYSPLNPPEDASQNVPPVVKERRKNKMSLKSRKDKGFGKVVEDEYMKEVENYREDAEGKREDGTSKNPFHRAKKHIKTFIAGNSKVKLEKHEAVLLDSGSEGDEVDPSSSTQKSASNSSSTQSTLTLSEHYLEPTEAVFEKRPNERAFTSLISNKTHFEETLERKVGSTSSSSSTHMLRRESSGASSDQGGDYMSMPAGEHGPFGSRLDEVGKQRGFSQKENIPLGQDVTSYHHKRKGSDSLEQSRKSSISSTEQQQPASFQPRQHARLSSSRDSYYNGRSSEEISQENVRRWANATTSYDGQSDRESTVRESVRNLIGMFADINTRQPPHLPLKTYNSSTVNEPESPKQPEYPTTPNKAGRTSSIPSLGGSREIRRTRSVSETRQPVHSRREFSLEPSPYVSADFMADVPGDEMMMMPGITGSYTGPKSKTGFHMLEKVTKFHRGETCGACRKNMHVLFAPGMKCAACKHTFHSKCVQNGVIQDVPCRSRVLSSNDEGTPSMDKQTNTSTRRKQRKQKINYDGGKPGKFSLTGTSEFTDRTDQIISGVKELRQMQEFISNKIYQVSRRDGTKASTVDRVFEQALREFKESLVSTYSVASKQADSIPLNIRYKDLIANFTNIMETVSKQESIGMDSLTTMGVNAFRGFLNEFMNTQRIDEKPSKANKVRKERRPKEPKGGKRAKVEDNILHLGHAFVPMVINIPTACEFCSSFIMWPIERGMVCQKCKLACHKKCYHKIISECNESSGGLGAGGATGIFGSPLVSLIVDGASIPRVVDQLITAIELYGLRMEGLYRKSGVSSRVKELKQDIEDGKAIDCELYPVHVLTSVLKSFFRDMPEPLLTHELYDEFLRAAQLSQPEDRINTLFALLKKLPKPNYDLMERLVFHLVRVALCEDKNRMNANSLAILFAPCILRSNKIRQVQESLNDIGRQTMCLETVILEQMKKVKETLHNIESVDSAAHSFSVRLNSIRSSKMQMKTSPDRKKSVGSSGSLSEASGDIKLIHESSTPESMSAEEEEEYLTQHIKHLQDEKAMLTSVLPSLSRTPSDEDMLSTDPEIDSPGGSVDDLHQGNVSPSPRTVRAQSLQYSKSDSLVSESCQSTSIAPARAGTAGGALLHNIMKNRGPLRKPPSRFVRNLGSVDFGERDHHYRPGGMLSSAFGTAGASGAPGPSSSQPFPVAHEEDESVISVDQNNDEEAILV